ncbi:MAG: hypothetical protein ACLSB9_20755 [Hydrogeniiclostridium mannosilyticum]
MIARRGHGAAGRYGDQSRDRDSSGVGAVASEEGIAPPVPGIRPACRWRGKFAAAVNPQSIMSLSETFDFTTAAV